jgi:hypothetical protein
MASTLPDLTGATFGKLTVVEAVAHGDRGHRRYLVQCACGSSPRVVLASALLRGHTKSCGCLIQEHLQRIKRSFGRYRSRKEMHGAPES